MLVTSLYIYRLSNSVFLMAGRCNYYLTMQRSELLKIERFMGKGKFATL